MPVLRILKRAEVKINFDAKSWRNFTITDKSEFSGKLQRKANYKQSFSLYFSLLSMENNKIKGWLCVAYLMFQN